MCIAGVEDVYSKPRHMLQCKMEPKAYKRVYGDSKRHMTIRNVFFRFISKQGKEKFPISVMTYRYRERESWAWGV